MCNLSIFSTWFRKLIQGVQMYPNQVRFLVPDLKCKFCERLKLFCSWRNMSKHFETSVLSFMLRDHVYLIRYDCNSTRL